MTTEEIVLAIENTVEAFKFYNTNIGNWLEQFNNDQQTRLFVVCGYAIHKNIPEVKYIPEYLKNDLEVKSVVQCLNKY